MKKFWVFAALAVAAIAPFSVHGLENSQQLADFKSITGSIVSQNDDKLVVQSAQDESNKVVLSILPDTYIADSTTGLPVKLAERTNDSISAYYGPAETRSIPPQSNATAIILNIPENTLPPKFAQVEKVDRDDNQIRVITNGGSMIVTLPQDMPLTDFKTGKTLEFGNIDQGTDLLMWYDAVAMSYPGQAVAKKAVVLGKNKLIEPSAEPEAAKLEEKTAVPAQGDGAKVEDKQLPADETVGGHFPQVNGMANTSLQKKVNHALNKIYSAGVKQSKADGNKVAFSYDVKPYDGMTSIIVHTAVDAGNTSSDKVSSIVYDENKIYTLTDLLGENANRIADETIKTIISQGPAGQYFSGEEGFQGINKNTAFYVDTDGKVVIVFDKYSIAPGSSGTPEFKINARILKPDDAKTSDK